jgi:hypothetical protein
MNRMGRKPQSPYMGWKPIQSATGFQPHSTRSRSPASLPQISYQELAAIQNIAVYPVPIETHFVPAPIGSPFGIAFGVGNRRAPGLPTRLRVQQPAQR